MNIPKIRELLAASKLYPSKLKSAYCFGSRVYGTSNDTSDWDFVMIANTPDTNKEIKYYSIFSRSNLNLHIMTTDQFLQHLKEHRSFAIECFFAPEDFRLHDAVRFNWSPKRSSLIHSFTHISNNSWYSHIDKFEDNYYQSIKNVFHSIRVPYFGIQILKHGKIINFQECNGIHEKLQSKNWTLDEINSEFDSFRKEVLFNFRNS